MVTDYQVFISFRNVGQDAVLAENLYRELKKRDIRVFFSKYSIDETAHADYVDAIDEALEKARLMVVVGTSRKNLSSKWVKAEINQFRALMNGETRGKRSLTSYRSKEYPEHELPSGLKPYQSFSDLNALVRFIEVSLGKDTDFQKADDGTALLNSAPRFADGTNTSPVPDGFYINHCKKCIQPGDLIDGKYRIVSKVGQGGMSVVYLAVNERANRQFAVKEFHRDSVKEFDVVLKSFRGEVELMKYLNHPAIPKIYDVINTPDSMILVMDFVNGSSLRQILETSGPLNEELALNYARQIGGVLHYLHTQPVPIIYRDMKPGNIIALPNGMIKLVDFGVARRYSTEYRIQDTTCLGTIGYAAPEQFGGMGQSDARTDIYNLGVTLHHLVTGHSPSEPPYEIRPIRQYNPELSRGLEIIIEKCTQRDPAQRFQTAQEFLDALDNIKRVARQDALRSFFLPKAHSPKVKEPQSMKPSLPQPTQYQLPQKTESVFDTTVLPPAVQRETLPEPPTVVLPPEQLMPPVSPEPASNKEAEVLLKKLSALDADSQRIVRDLIDRLSKQ